MKAESSSSKRDGAANAQALKAALPMREASPELISGRYRLDGKLGEGGMASVFRVHDVETGKNLALKRLGKSSSAKLLALFEREFHLLASLRHPAIVRAFDYGADAISPYYTMELLQGSDVSSLAPMPWQRACKVLRDVASGLSLLHARRLVHRDLSARNVWLTPEGELKLIDFGTLADFGKPGDVVGTPPFVAPEALHGRELDQRSDLYALGALAYFLITGRHAFPAHNLPALEPLWAEVPRAPSQRVRDLARDDLPAVPAALDELVFGLLSRDVLARPINAAALIDRLTVIASLERERPARVLDNYLSTPAFVGRLEEREKLASALAEANAGAARVVLVQSAAGLGRTRLLAEFALQARLAGATVLRAESSAAPGTHEVAQQLSFALLTALPVARELAKPFAPTLGHLSPAMRERLGLSPEQLADVPQTHGEARMRVQAALRDWFLAVAREHALVVLADDLDTFDEASAAWLVTLSLEARAHKLLIVGSTRSDRGALSLPLEALKEQATCLSLAPLTREETHTLFASVFGDVPFLARLSDRIHQRAEGSPRHAIDLAEHLSREGVIAYADGSWLLPQSIDEVALPETRKDAELSRLARLSDAARTLGGLLSVHAGVLPLAMCAELSQREGGALLEPLEELEGAGVLVRGGDGYRFARESLRSALHAQATEADKQGAHRRLGQLLLRAPDLTPIDRLKAGVHLLLSGDEDEGSRAVASAGQHYGLVDLAGLGPAAPALEDALVHFRKLGRSPYELASLLAPLALAGYYADKRLATRYGMQAVELLARLVGLSLARRLSPWLGKKLGLIIGLVYGAVGFALRAKNPRVPKFKQAMMMLFNCVAALTGASTLCLDLAAARRYTSVLRPMIALGPNHVATFMYDFCSNLIGTLQDYPAQGRSRWIHMTKRLDRPKAKQDLGDVHALYLAGALYAQGVGECRRDDSAAPHCAERLQSFGLKLYDMSADQVRMVYYANRGDLEAFSRYRDKVEVHAIQRGTAWQVETWMASGMMSVHMRTGDVAGLKECVEQTKRLSVDVPSLAPEHARALAGYLVLCGKPREALQVMDEYVEEPSEVIGWSRGQGMRARALNDLGEHQRARETCERTLEHVSDEDLAFEGNNLGLLIELARAEAGVGELSAGEARLDELIEERLALGNPLSLGALYEARCELARLRGDQEACARALAEAKRWFLGTRHPSLVARYERLLKRAAPSQQGALEGDSPHLLAALHSLRHGGDPSLQGSGAWALKQLSEVFSVGEAYLFVQSETRDTSFVASVANDARGSSLMPWVHDQLQSVDREAVTRTMDIDSALGADATATTIDGRTYRLVMLRAGAVDEHVVGALVLPETAELPASIIREISARMHTSVSLHSMPPR